MSKVEEVECWAVYDCTTENINTSRVAATEKHLRDRLNKELGELYTSELLKYGKIKLVKCKLSTTLE